MASRYDFGNIGNWNLFGNQKKVGPRPTWQEFAGSDQKLQENERQEWIDAISDWEYIKGQQQNQQDIFTKMGQNVGPVAPKFVTNMGTREAPQNMMASLFPSKFGMAGAGTIDPLSPEVESYFDWELKKQNMFRA